MALPGTAAASQLIARDASNVTLRVDAKGQALLSYTARDKRWDVLAWGAVNAVQPTPDRRQVAADAPGMVAGGQGDARDAGADHGGELGGVGIDSRFRGCELGAVIVGAPLAQQRGRACVV